MGGLAHGGEYGYAPPRGYVAARPEKPPLDDLLSRYWPDLRGFIARRVSDPGLVDDIAQETLFRAYRARNAYDRNRPIWPWLSTIAKNTICNTVRGENVRRRHIDVDADWGDIETYADRRLATDPEERLASKERRAAIAQALSSLRPRQRRMLLMRVDDGMPYDEIAQLEGLSVDAVKSSLKRTRRAFRTAYDGASPEGDGLAAFTPLLNRVSMRVRLSYDRARTRVAHIADVLRFTPGLEGFAQAVTAGVAGALLFSAFAVHSPRPRLPAQPATVVATVVRSPARHPNSPGSASETSGEYLVHREVKTGVGATGLEVKGAISNSRPDRRTVHIGIDYMVPGVSGDGHDTGADVPCAIFGTNMCGLVGPAAP
jgi:RNA polymerase sigma-70 factor (ECF subfamily)